MNRRIAFPGPRGFTLIELLVVVSVIVVLAALVVPSLVGITKGRSFTNGLNQISDYFNNARAAAMANNTYVWVGIVPLTTGSAADTDQVDEVVLAAVFAKNGQSSDLSQGNYLPLGKGVIVKNLMIPSTPFAADTLPNSGREPETEVDQVATSSLPVPSGSSGPLGFSETVGTLKVNNLPPGFSELIQFGPTGNASIKSTASRCIEIDLESTPGPPQDGILQIDGLTGQIRIYE